MVQVLEVVENCKVLEVVLLVCVKAVLVHLVVLVVAKVVLKVVVHREVDVKVVVHREVVAVRCRYRRYRGRWSPPLEMVVGIVVFCL